MNELFLKILLSFLFGGFLCFLAQLLIDFTGIKPAKILVIYVCFGVFLYSVGLYDYLFSIFGRGISVPLVGFGAAIGKGVKDAVFDCGFLGIFSGGISAASQGISLSLFLGLIFSLIFKSKQRRM